MISDDSGWSCKKAKHRYLKGMQKLKTTAYEDGYQDYKHYGERKDPIYPKELMKNLIDYRVAPSPDNGTEVIYDEYYEKGYQEARNKKR